MDGETRQARGDSFGKRIKLAIDIDNALSELGISNPEFAKMIGCNASSVASWKELGPTPSSKFFSRIMDELGLDPEDYGFDMRRKPSEIGKIIAAARYEKGLTLQQLADQCGTHIDTLLKIEKGVRRPAPRTLKAVCRVLGIDEEEMLIKREEMPCNKKERAAALAGTTTRRTK